MQITTQQIFGSCSPSLATLCRLSMNLLLQFIGFTQNAMKNTDGHSWIWTRLSCAPYALASHRSQNLAATIAIFCALHLSLSLKIASPLASKAALLHVDFRHHYRNALPTAYSSSIQTIFLTTLIALRICMMLHALHFMAQPQPPSLQVPLLSLPAPLRCTPPLSLLLIARPL